MQFGDRYDFNRSAHPRDDALRLKRNDGRSVSLIKSSIHLISVIKKVVMANLINDIQVVGSVKIAVLRPEAGQPLTSSRSSGQPIKE